MPPVNEIAISEKIRRRAESSMLSAGVEIIKNDACERLTRTIDNYILLISRGFALYFARLAPDDLLGKTQQDLESEAIESGIAILSNTLTNFVADVCRGEGIEVSSSKKVSCAQASHYTFELGIRYSEAIVYWISLDGKKIKSAKFRKKRQRRRYNIRDAIRPPNGKAA